MMLLQRRILQDHFLLWIHLTTVELHLDINGTQFYLSFLRYTLKIGKEHQTLKFMVIYPGDQSLSLESTIIDNPTPTNEKGIRDLVPPKNVIQHIQQVPKLIDHETSQIKSKNLNQYNLISNCLDSKFATRTSNPQSKSNPGNQTLVN